MRPQRRYGSRFNSESKDEGMTAPGTALNSGSTPTATARAGSTCRSDRGAPSGSSGSNRSTNKEDFVDLERVLGEGAHDQRGNNTGDGSTGNTHSEVSHGCAVWAASTALSYVTRALPVAPRYKRTLPCQPQHGTCGDATAGY